MCLALTLATSLAHAQNDCAFRLDLPDRFSGLGRRGFLGAPEPRDTEEAARINAAAAELSLMPWNVKIFVVRDAEDAARHDAIASRTVDLQKDVDAWKERWSKISGSELINSAHEHMAELAAQNREIVWNPLMTGLYVIDPNVDLARMTPEQRDALKHDLPNRAMFEVGEDGASLTQFDPELVRQRFNPRKMVATQYFAQEPMHFRQDGLFFPKVRGVLMVDTMRRQKSKTYKRLELRLAGDVNVERLTFTANQDLEGVMRGCMTQQRQGQTVENNRVTDDMIAQYKKMVSAVSFETWEPDGAGGRRLVAGTFGTFANGVLELNSIFYPPGKVDYARYLFMKAAFHLKNAGLDFINMGMVSAFSRGLRAEYWLADKFLELKARQSRDASPAFEDAWP